MPDPPPLLIDSFELLSFTDFLPELVALPTGEFVSRLLEEDVLLEETGVPFVGLFMLFFKGTCAIVALVTVELLVTLLEDFGVDTLMERSLWENSDKLVEQASKVGISRAVFGTTTDDVGAVESA